MCCILHYFYFVGMTEGTLLSDLTSCSRQATAYRGYYIPVDNVDIHYTQHETVSVEKCTKFCCSQKDCELIWIVDSVCYTVTCPRQGGCEPEKAKSGTQFEDSYMAFIDRLQGMFMLCYLFTV